MTRTQIYLTAAEAKGVQKLARIQRKTQSQIIRESIDAYLRANTGEADQALRRRARGIWRERSRAEFDRIRKTLERKF